MRYLILGSSGQIGSALSAYLWNIGERVRPFDIVDHADEDLRIYNNDNLDSAINSADFVMFAAFDVGGSQYLSKYEHTYDFISNNIKIMDRTFDGLKKWRKPFIFMSSQMSNMSYSPYGILKAIGEKYTAALGGLVTKFWNVYDIERDANKSHVITDFIISAHNKGLINCRTDGTEQRQFLFGEDCARALYILSKQYNEISRDIPLHITSFSWTSIREIAETISKIYGNKIRITFAPSKDEVQKDKRNEPDKTILQYWQPEVPIETGIRKIKDQIVEHYNKNMGISPLDIFAK